MIRAQGLVKKFGDFTAVDDISFDVAKGEIFAFLGPNGAGKTTTIKMLTTLLKPTSGSVELDGLDPVDASERGAHSASASCFRTPASTTSSPPTRTWISTACSTASRASCARAHRDACSNSFELWDRRNDLVKHSPAA